jgi:transcriptional regulator with XRE-family HTH domain
MDVLGRKIREERRRRNFTLEILSQKTNLSKGFLSQIERGLVQPSITSLKKISLAFGISVVNLFMDESSPNGSAGSLPSMRDNENGGSARLYVKDVKVVRKERRKSLSLPGSKIKYELLTPDLNRQVEVMYVRIGHGDHSGNEPMIDPPGEKCGLVLKGILQIQVDHETYQLHEGDSIYFPSHFPHSWRGVSKGATEVIWVLSPPWF